jgi:MarR family transcriptional regulator, organic hydroperoxide resistance regulator
MKESVRTPCLCASLRKATRVITRRYDKHLKPSDLKITQYSVLANINRNPGVTVSELANLMVMDQTTMTRNLQVLKKQGYLDIKEGVNDQRAKSIFVSEAGKKKFEQAQPYWEEAQLELEKNLGKLGFELFLKSLNIVVGK